LLSFSFAIALPGHYIVVAAAALFFITSTALRHAVVVVVDLHLNPNLYLLPGERESEREEIVGCYLKDSLLHRKK